MNPAEDGPKPTGRRQSKHPLLVISQAQHKDEALAGLERWKERFASFDNERGWRTLDAVRSIAKERDSSASAVGASGLTRSPSSERSHGHYPLSA